MPELQRKILIVDDSAEDRATFRRFLQQDATTAYLFEEANSGKKALAAYQTFHPDCLLLDYRMPDLDGLQFLERLYEQAPAHQASAVVVLTGTGNEAVAAEAIKRGAQDYLVKDAVTPERLRYAVANAIEKVSLLRALEAQRHQLQESEARFRALVNTAPALIWEADPDGAMTLVSDQWLEYCGMTAEQLTRDWPQLVLHPDDYERCITQWAQARAQGVTYEVEVRNRRHDGVYRWFLTRAVPARNAEGQITGWYGTTTDIHDRKLLEDELRQFSHIVSHDLREPLRTMSNFVKLLATQYQGKLDATAEEYITFVTDGAQRMQQMINDLLKYTRAGKPLDAFTAVDCETLIAQILVDLQVAITESGATITHDPLPLVHGDATRLKQVWQNLIGNALKFRGAAPPQIHLSAQREARHWRFGVRDNGIGIDPAQSKHLFQVFQRLHTRAEYPGTGIGLAICRKIVEQHGGRMWVESAPGTGSTFYFTIGTLSAELP